MGQMGRLLLSGLVVLFISGNGESQLTAQTSVAPELRECYMNTTLINRNNLPPTSIAVLIDIIQKIEDNPNINIDLRQMAVVLLHTYRQDGIEYHQPDITTYASNVLPYAPTFHSFYRHKLLLTKLIPNNFQVLSNETINSSLKCALHHMLSTTIDARQRGDESSCNSLAQYRSLPRIPRDVGSLDSDVEILDDSELESANRLGQMKQYNPNDDVEYNAYEGISRSERQVLGDSQCPILDGVVHTPWGAVSAGNLIAGIAAGAESQRVSLTELIKGSVLSNEFSNVQQYVTTIYPATLSGDLAEAALIQGTERSGTTISVGITGGWNSTESRKYYMLQSRLNIEMTDPEIRGDIDGFFLGSILPSVSSTYSSLKLSQLLDMYYAPRNGIYNNQYRACNRKDLSTQFISATTLATETQAFAAALDTNVPLKGTITSGLEELVTNAVTNFQSYVTNNLHDVNCVTTEASSHDYRLRTNLYITLDSSWQYEAVYPAISHILDSIEVGKYGSSVTLISAFDGSLVINKTFSLADFHTEYTRVRHETLFAGVNLINAYANINTQMLNELDNERAHSYVGGNSTVLIFLINSGNLLNSDELWEQARKLNDTVPDLRVLYATSTNQQTNLWNLVRDMHNDIFTISLTSNGLNLDTALGTLINRIHTVGRRVINPVCGSEWTAGTLSGTRQFDDFVEPGYVNYYAISANYFYQNNDNRKIRISRSNAGIGTLNVCHSRTVIQPRENGSLNLGLDDHAITCQSISSTGNVEISLQNACSSAWTINSCPSLYVSVESVTNGAVANSAVCTDTHLCRFPYNIRYQVQIQDFGCYSAGRTLHSNFALVLLVIIAVYYQYFK